MNTPDPHPTAHLLSRARNGDDGATSALFATGVARLEAYAHARLGPTLRSRVEVDDVVQDTMVRALDSLGDFESRASGSFGAWLCRIAENVIRNLAAHHGAARRNADAEVDRASRVLAGARTTAAGPMTRAADHDEFRALGAALDGLDDELREVVLLRHFQECTIDEIAEHTRRSPTAVRRALGRAMRTLGDTLGGPQS